MYFIDKTWRDQMILVKICLNILSLFRFFQYLAYCPEIMMRNILAHVHEITPPPPDWSGNPQTSKVRNEFSIIFQYIVVSHMYLCNALFLGHFNTHEILLRLWYIEPNQKFLRFGLNFRNVFLSATFIYESNLILLVWRNNLFYC